MIVDTKHDHFLKLKLHIGRVLTVLSGSIWIKTKIIRFQRWAGPTRNIRKWVNMIIKFILLIKFLSILKRIIIQIFFYFFLLS